MSLIRCSYPWQRSLRTRSSFTEQAASPWQLCPCSLMAIILIPHHGLVSIDLSFDQVYRSSRSDLARLRLAALRLN